MRHYLVAITGVVLRPDHQYRVAGVTDDGFRYATQDPTFHTRSSMGAHGDQIVRGLTRKGNDLIGSEAFLGDAGNFLDPHLFKILGLSLQVRSRFFSKRFNQLMINGRIVTGPPEQELMRAALRDRG